MDFKNIPNKYRPIPFWSWNEKLEVEETKRQIGIMHDAGLGGFFMHARGGLQTEYMSDEWFDNVEASNQVAKKFNMGSWAYDENGWPSGFGNGFVNGKGVEYQQKYLRMEDTLEHTETQICKNGDHYFYYEINPFYVDTLDKKVIAEFINYAYEPYYKKYGNEIEGFFTDEPQVSRNGIPWSFVFEKEYSRRYNDNILEHLEDLFIKKDGYKITRVRFWKMVTELFSESYMKQIYDWCDARNLKFTGHMVLEEDLLSQLPCSGACMPHYEYFHIPGMDWLGRNIACPSTPLQLVSVAAQMGKKQILCETFALCGHNVSFSELRRIYEWQMSRGINLLCQHLEGYSLRGLRKRDYPPAMYYQQPWWQAYKKFNDSMSRIGMIIANGEVECDTLLIHPQTTAWICYDFDKNEGIEEYNEKFFDAIRLIESKHVQFHLGDEIMMERHARVEGDRLIIGEMSYSTVVLPENIMFLDNTNRLLKEFADNGGKIITPDQVSENTVIDNSKITYLKRVFNDFDMHYFANNTTEYQAANINVNGMALDIMTGDLKPFAKDYKFAPMDSLIVIDKRDNAVAEVECKDLEKISLDGEWDVISVNGNALTLDRCDCYFDGELVEKNIPITSIQALACDLKREVNIRCEFKVNIEHIANDLSLVCETPEIFTYKINGKEINFVDEGYFRDRSFRKSNISKYVKNGENTIEMTCMFSQTEKTYENIEKSKIFESEKNKLAYDMEIESIYLIGDFSIKTDAEFVELERDGLRYNGSFVISQPKSKVEIKHLEQQGFTFWCGDMTLRKTINISNVNSKIDFNMHGINAVKLVVNGVEVDTVIWNHTQVDLSGYLKQGKNIIELTLINNLRNLLGPHHLEEGESYFVGHASFFRGDSMWSWAGFNTEWNDEYCFVNTGLE